MQIRPFLNFKGQCKDAIELYEKAFGTTVNAVMHYGDMPSKPDAPPIPDDIKNHIVQATLPVGDNYIRMCDSSHTNSIPSELVSISVECTVDEAKNAFAVLSEGGNVVHEISETFFSPCYCSVIDKFGIKWEIAASAAQRKYGE